MKDAGTPSIVFMGTPVFSVPFLDGILKSGRRISCVVTQPDKPKGRGRRLIPPPVKEFALEYNIPVFQPSKLSDQSFVESIKQMRPQYIVVVAYGKIITTGILKIPSKGCINVHASLLPEYRGASPIQWAIINGRPYTGVTTMMMDKTLDTGDTLLQEKIDIDRSDTAGSLSIKLSAIGVNLLIRTLDRLGLGELVPQPQDHTKASYAPLIKKEDGLIDWYDSSENIYNKIRGFDPWPGTYTWHKGDRWGIWKAEVLERVVTSYTPGEIIEVQPDVVIVTTGDSALKVTEIQAEGKKRMRVSEYLRGHRVEAGVMLGKGTGNIDTP